jgi:hypothetical protein
VSGFIGSACGYLQATGGFFPSKLLEINNLTYQQFFVDRVWMPLRNTARIHLF